MFLYLVQKHPSTVVENEAATVRTVGSFRTILGDVNSFYTLHAAETQQQLLLGGVSATPHQKILMIPTAFSPLK